MNAASFSRCLFLYVVLLSLGGCSMKQMAVQGSIPLLKGGDKAMNRETDLDLARAAMPANLKVLEGMTYADPGNEELHLFAARGFYGYAFAFVEAEDRQRASALYRRCRGHAAAALTPPELATRVQTASLDELGRMLENTGQSSVPALFWTASCWAKWIDLNRDDVQGIAQVSHAVALMERVLQLDETYYYAGPHLFFGVYYGSRTPILGGDFKRAEKHFDRARDLTRGKLLMVDVLEAEYLDRQRLDRQAFHERLTKVLAAPEGLLPEMALANRVSKQRARALLEHEDAWF